jgi:hypothetical protein
MAARIMRDGDTGVGPVLEHAQSLKVVRVVTDRDLGMTVVAEARDATGVCRPAWRARPWAVPWTRR